MKTLLVLLVSCFSLSSSHASLEDIYRSQYCNYAGAYKAGMNDGRDGKKMREGFAYFCTKDEKPKAEKGYRKGYNRGLRVYKAEVKGKKKLVLIEDRREKRKYRRHKSWGCLEAFGQKKCGFGCVRSFGKIYCGKKPGMTCLSSHGTTKCGFGCVSRFGKVFCGERRGMKCETSFGKTACGYQCESAFGKIACSKRRAHNCVRAFGEVRCGRNCRSEAGEIKCDSRRKLRKTARLTL